METKEFLEKCDKAEKWFYESKYGKGRIAGFVPMLMAEYADFYHESEVKKLNINAVSNSGGIEREDSVCVHPYNDVLFDSRKGKMYCHKCRSYIKAN